MQDTNLKPTNKESFQSSINNALEKLESLIFDAREAGLGCYDQDWDDFYLPDFIIVSSEA